MSMRLSACTGLCDYATRCTYTWFVCVSLRIRQRRRKRMSCELFDKNLLQGTIVEEEEEKKKI